MLLALFTQLLLFFFFASIASFLMVSAERTLMGQPFIKGRSHCNACGRTLSPIALIPLLGYILEGGQCAHCKMKIPIRYPLMEAAFAGLALVFIRPLWPLPYGFAIYCVLFLMASSDLYRRIVPDRWQALLLGILILFAFQYGTALSLILSFARVFIVALGLFLLSCFLPQKLGGADEKTLILLAFYLPWVIFLKLLLYATALALVYYFVCFFVDRGKIKQALPFMPFIWLAWTGILHLFPY